MKRIILPLLILAVAGVAAYFLFFKKDDKPTVPEDKQKPLAVGEHSGTFTQSYNKLLAAYMGLKDALVASDTAKASAAARELAVASDSLKLNEIQGDTSGIIKETALTYTSIISSSSKAWQESPPSRKNARNLR